MPKPEFTVVGYYDDNDSTFFKTYCDMTVREAVAEAEKDMGGFGVIVCVFEGDVRVYIANRDDLNNGYDLNELYKDIMDKE
jgi:hypothetical protein